MAAEPLTARSADDDAAGRGRSLPDRAVPAQAIARGTERVPELDAALADDDRFARLTTIGRRTGRARTVTVGFVPDLDGSILVAAGGPDAAWAANLGVDAAVEVAIGSDRFRGLAELIDRSDARFGRAIRDLILRYGTPSEGLGTGPVFAIHRRPER